MRSHGLAMMALIVFGLGLGCGGGGSDITGNQTTTPPPALAITSGSPPSGSVGTSYAGNGFSLSASGGTAPYQWSWTAAAGSSLPTGLKISTSGLISGTPQVASTYVVTVKVTDSSSPAVQVNANYSIDVAGTPALTITSDVPPDGAERSPGRGGRPPQFDTNRRSPPGVAASPSGATPTARVAVTRDWSRSMRAT